MSSGTFLYFLGMTGPFAGMVSPKQAGKSAIGLAGFERCHSKGGNAFFLCIFRVLKHYVMCEDNCTGNPQPWIVRGKEIFWKVFLKKETGLLLGLMYV